MNEMGNIISCIVKVKFISLLSEINHSGIDPICKNLASKVTDRIPAALIAIGMLILLYEEFYLLMQLKKITPFWYVVLLCVLPAFKSNMKLPVFNII
jgi:hypothetical protein